MTPRQQPGRRRRSRPKWKLVWSDEFNGTAGTAPNPASGATRVGDGTVNGIPGWGNDELEYYTDGTDQRRDRRRRATW